MALDTRARCMVRTWAISDFDACDCGDYRHQHIDGTGQCRLGSLCTPSHCQQFRLCLPASEIPNPYAQASRESKP